MERRRCAFFVTRQKDNARYKVLEEKPVPMNRSIMADQIIELEGFLLASAVSRAIETSGSLG
jgi:hypothetical protein